MDCTAHPDYYGAGLRVGFYLLWFAIVTAAWFVPREAALVRSVLLLFVLGAFLALVVDVAGPHLLTGAEVYIVLLLCYATYYAYLPLYAWRLATGCSPAWDPARAPAVFTSDLRSRRNQALGLASLLVHVAMTIFGLWFFTNLGAFAHCADRADRAFLFASVPLRNQLFIALNVVIGVVLLLGRTIEVLFALHWLRHPRWLRKKQRKLRKKGLPEDRLAALSFISGFFALAVATVLVAAVEMAIQYNLLDRDDDGAVNAASTTAQLVPLCVGAGLFLRVLWVGIRDGWGRAEDDDSVVVVEEVYERRERPSGVHVV